ETEIVRRRHLEVVRRVGHDVHGETGALAQLGIIGWRRVAGAQALERAGEHVAREALRGLRAPQPFARYRPGHALRFSYLLHCIAPGSGRPRAASAPRALDHGINRLPPYEGTRGIVHQDYRYGGAEGVEPGSDRLGACGATRDPVESLAGEPA